MVCAVWLKLRRVRKLLSPRHISMMFESFGPRHFITSPVVERSHFCRTHEHLLFQIFLPEISPKAKMWQRKRWTHPGRLTRSFCSSFSAGEIGLFVWSKKEVRIRGSRFASCQTLGGRQERRGGVRVVRAMCDMEPTHFRGKSIILPFPDETISFRSKNARTFLSIKTLKLPIEILPLT